MRQPKQNVEYFIVYNLLAARKYKFSPKMLVIKTENEAVAKITYEKWLSKRKRPDGEKDSALLKRTITIEQLA
jgi:hypothetical protein